MYYVTDFYPLELFLHPALTAAAAAATVLRIPTSLLDSFDEFCGFYL
jgi:hypothetical protein